MSKAAKNILTLNYEEAMDSFVKFEQFHRFELQEYYNRLKVVLAEIDRTGTWILKQEVSNIGTISRWITNKVQPSVNN